ncbi:MAG: hypothetical protein HDS67_04775 [Bacteroidales bacterium]|nr:hypothetical protein [Bacteroidales bacterium]
MKRLLFLILGCFGAVVFGWGENPCLKQLDRVLTGDFVSVKEHRLDSLKRLEGIVGLEGIIGMDGSRGSGGERGEVVGARGAVGGPGKDIGRWDLYHRLAGEYASFNTDSALRYNRMARAVASSGAERMRSDIQLASLYNSSKMMYKEANDLFSAIKADSADRRTKCDYFILGVQLFRNLESLAPDDSLRRVYTRRKQAFRDSVMALVPDEKFIRANELLDAGRSAEVFELFRSDMSDKGYSRANGAMYHILARASRQTGDREMEKEYLAMAAKADIENGVREYLALPQLALLLYEEGDVDRAYRYMRRSIEDAKACNAPVRLFDMTEAIPVISEAYAVRQRSLRTSVTLLLVLVCILLAGVVVSLQFVRRRNRQLSRAREKLEESNHRLAVAGTVREKYVRRFMYLSREYLEKLDGYRSHLFKIGSTRNLDKLLDAIRSADIVERSADTFYASFDQAFLELYPDFVDEFNSFMRPEERIMLKEEGILNTELRIFALMKLGITESAEIARFLHCSQSTVYNYRTRYRAKALDKDAFVAFFFGENPQSTPTN